LDVVGVGHSAPPLKAGALASLSRRLANNGAGDRAEMVTIGLLSERCFGTELYRVCPVWSRLLAILPHHRQNNYLGVR
jgi:hypothetical protein